jgi:hypothetical protein
MWYSGLWCRVLLKAVTNVSEEHIATIFSSEDSEYRDNTFLRNSGNHLYRCTTQNTKSDIFSATRTLNLKFNSL